MDNSTHSLRACWGFSATATWRASDKPCSRTPGFRIYRCATSSRRVHLAAAFAKASNRLRAFACTSSIGPGATNMITGAALATINRLPVLLLPGDIFARRNVAPVLQQLESPATQDIGVNDCFKPVSRYWDRIYRPDQLISSLPEAMRVLTSPSDCGAVTLALPQDVQAEAFDYPEETVREDASGTSAAPRARSSQLESRGGCDPRQPPAVDCGGRRRTLQRSHRGTGPLRRADRHPCGRDPGGQGLPGLRSPAKSWAPSASPALRAPTRGSRGRLGHRHRHALFAISPRHPRPRSRIPRSASSISTSRNSMPSSTPPCPWWATRASGWSGSRRP